MSSGRSSSQLMKCNYCRTEFHPESKSNSICVKCKQLEEQNGKPGPCAYCNIIAAFIGTKCQRCTNSEKKYGPPMACEQCKQKCAFDRQDPDGKKKVDGKLLCWLCTMAYKRTLARARQKEAARISSSSHHNKSSSSDAKPPSHSSSRHHSHNHHHHHNHHHNNNSGSSGNHHSNHHHHHHSSSSNNHAAQGSNNNNTDLSSFSHGKHSSSSHLDNGNAAERRDTLSSSQKKQRLETNHGTNAHHSSASSNLMGSSLMDGRFIEPNGTGDLSAVVAQLKDQVAMLTKKLQVKEKELLSKDQQIAELRATITRDQRDSKEKINSIQKQHSDRVSELQAKIITMQKQNVSQARAARANTTNYVEPPLVI